MSNQLQQIKTIFKKAASGDQTSLQQATQFLQVISKDQNQIQQLQQFATQDQEFGKSLEQVIKIMQGIKAQLGAKLEYIQHLTAPKFACGGKTKKKKCQDGEKLDPIQEYKCGRKMKRKMTEGGQTPKKTIKIKKPIDKKPVNPNDTINLPQGPRSLTDKEKRYPRLTKAEYRKLSRSKQADVDLKDSASGRSVN